MAVLPVHFERVERFWLAPVYKSKIAAGIALYGYAWTHSNFDWLKVLLNERLRGRQSDRCCYCRRALVFDKGHVELDHIIDKGSQNGMYARFTFEARNLALACKDCNNNKGTKPVLANPLAPNSPYPQHPRAFLWVHPHLHEYSDHITIHQGWVYEAQNASLDGLAVIRKCNLDKLRSKERENRRVLVDGAANLKDAVARAVGMVGDVGLDNLCKELGSHLSKKWKSASCAEVQQAIRDANTAIQSLNLP
jgi:hypothetical protein